MHVRVGDACRPKVWIEVLTRTPPMVWVSDLDGASGEGWYRRPVLSTQRNWVAPNVAAI